MKTKVKLREENRTVEVPITNENKPAVSESIMSRWQTIINIVAELFDVPAGLIMRITNTHMTVFLKSQNEDNPYPADGKDTLLHGLYCETVIGRDQELHVANSLDDEAWKDNPDVALDMISYYGLPIKWSDGEVFGTICALDNKTNAFDERYRKLLQYFQDMIEGDLRSLEEIARLEELSGTDWLTRIGNRRTLELDCRKAIESYKRHNHPFGLILFDINKFKVLNDTYGHVTGDHVLQRMASVIRNRIRLIDGFYRYGGDEFVLLIKEPVTAAIDVFMNDIQQLLLNDDFLSKFELKLSYGYVIANDDHTTCLELIEAADRMLYQVKQQR